MKQHLAFAFLLSFIAGPTYFAWAQEEPMVTTKPNKPASKAVLPPSTGTMGTSLDEPSQKEIETQAIAIIDRTKKANPRYRSAISMRSGLMQLVINTPDDIALNTDKTLPFIGVEAILPLMRDISIEARYVYAQNILYAAPASSPNKDSANQTALDAGLRYTFIPDATQPGNYFATHLLYHQTTNNFKQSSPDALLYINTYTGVIWGVEKGFSVTPKIGLNASLDVLNIMDAQTKSSLLYEKTGIGFQVRGETYYLVDWFGHHGRLGAAFWQTGFSNKLAASSVDGLNKNTQFQSYRAVSASYSFLF